MISREAPAVNNQPSVANDERPLYNARAPLGDVHRKEVCIVEVLDFLKAVGAGVVANCVYNVAVRAIKWLKQKLQ